ncbi:MAG: ribosome assembly RNA-binding protein YhbY [Thioalkalivibrionaceae bacterium]
MALLPNQVRFLRGLAHHRRPIVSVGRQGLRESVIEELDRALDQHELVKVKVAIGDRQVRHSTIAELCQQTQAECLQTIGMTAVLFRRNPKNPVIDLSAVPGH